MSSLAYRLAKKIKEDVGIEVEPVIHRTWTSYFHDSEGANKWFMYEIRTDGRSPKGVGCGTPASECVKRKYKLEFGSADLTGTQLFARKQTQGGHLNE